MTAIEDRIVQLTAKQSIYQSAKQPISQSIKQWQPNYQIKHLLHDQQAVVIDVTEQWISLAAITIDNDALQQIESMANKSVRVIQLEPKSMTALIGFEQYNQLRSADSNDDNIANNYLSVEQLMVMDSTPNQALNKPINDFLQWLLTYSFQRNVSDIHFEPSSEQGLIRIRIDGLLQRLTAIPISSYTTLINRLKIAGRMDISEKRRPQDGRIKVSSLEEVNIHSTIELRLATLVTAHGEKLVIRIFNPQSLNQNFQQMGFNHRLQQAWLEGLQRPSGLLLVVGPTGSGKTTTLYNSLKTINRDEINICTVEDPIEMVVDGYNQTQVQTNIGVSFPTAIRALLRQDPDAIMVGEIRDTDTADMAMRAALTGHLVLSTLHTENCSQSITRLEDLGVPPTLIRTCLIGVLSQRLLRVLCEQCKQPTASSEFIEGEGCSACSYSSYSGRIGIFEMMLIQHQDNNKKQDSNLTMQQLVENSIIQTLATDAQHKLEQGITSTNEIVRVLGMNSTLKP